MSFVFKYKLYYLIPIVLIGILFLSARPYSNSQSNTNNKPFNNPKFDKYWNQGKGEITSYELEQARYGELHKGHAVLIFVTEPFSKSKQVKLNTIHRNEEDVVQVLKLNFSKKFATGIYDYSILQSVFTPIDINNYDNTIKVTTSIQDWCGHTFTQLNLQTYKYKVLLNSYFESEGDQEFQIEQSILEDELWNLIRIAPSELPTGSFQMIPSIATTRLQHHSLDIEDVEASLSPHADNKELMTYALNFSISQRSLKIHYHKKFPHEIEGWEETYIDSGKELTTKATRKKTLLCDYWNKNRILNNDLRKELGLED